MLQHMTPQPLGGTRQKNMRGGGSSSHRRSSCASRRSHHRHYHHAEPPVLEDEQAQSTEEIFLESQRAELELELAALHMIFNCSKDEQLLAPGDDEWSDGEPHDGAPQEHVPNDEDCASLQAQLEQLRLQISTSTISVDSIDETTSSRRMRSDKRTAKRARN